MPTDLGKVERYKERISSYLQTKGPSLPIHIANALGVSTIFASAFLGEMFSDRQLKMSSMRVGSSPIYYLAEQEAQLEQFVEYLNVREREALALLKDQKILKDEEQPPVVRVALRAIPDFAKSFSVRDGSEVKVFWRYFTVSEAEANSFARSMLGSAAAPVQEVVTQLVQPQVMTQAVAPLVLEIEKPQIEKSVQIMQAPEPVVGGEKKVSEETEEKVKVKKEKKIVVKEDSDFVKQVKEHFAKRKMELVREVLSKKKEFHCVVALEGPLGRQEYFVVAKEKKSVSDSDLTVAHQVAQMEKMPALFISNGGLHTKGKVHLQTWGNLVRFDKIL